MPHGYPPWSGIKRETIYALPLDLGELAARLGSILTHDRRGDVLWMESFEDGLGRIEPLGGGAGVAAVLSTHRARSGGYSAKWALGPQAADDGVMFKALPYPSPSKVGMEISFTVHDDLERLYLSFGFNTPGTSRTFAIKYVREDKELLYKGSDDKYHSFATGVDLSPDDRLFHTMILVIDMEKDTYERLILNELTPSLPQVATKVDTNSYQPALLSMILAYPVDGKSPIIYIDDWIITQNQP